VNLGISASVHLAISCLAACLVWFWYRRTDNAAWIDTAWAGMIGTGALLHGLFSGASTLERWGLPMLMAAWSARLGAHLFRRTAGEPEDGRYAELRRRWSSRHGAGAIPGRFLVFYLMQALLATALALPAGLASFDRLLRWSPWQIASLVLGALSLLGSHLSDSRLSRFREDPARRGFACRDGFWRYSRHPNYFFEILLWISFALYATPCPGGSWAWLAPGSIAFFLFFVTGIPLTEAQALRTRGEDYSDYIRTTSPLIPWFPRKGSVP